MDDSPSRMVGIALVVHGDQVLVGERGPDGPLAGFAEFPGGKCDPGEAPAACAVRECREETGLDVDVLDLLDETVWRYPHATVHLHFYLCQPSVTPDPAATHRGFRWTAIGDLPALNFPDANRAAIVALQTLRTADSR